MYEVRTIFHEFGHGLHHLLSQVRYQSLAGTNVKWDFVELPSQIMENWILEPEGLKLCTKHYKTGESLPEEICKKIKKSEQFMKGLFGLRKVRFGLLDMKWHMSSIDESTNVLEFERQACKETTLIEPPKTASSSCSFAHIFAGGYACGYYSYKWAEVLDADAFELFKQKGIFNQEVSDSFRTNILEKGSSADPMTLYKKFRGKEPDPDSLFKKEGLV